eukprot:TRINITY_DN1866_c0_g1_i1.p1 TRINITY_DN1866_c0_g1~~TRINITY_DN1866_c0_g1_i1.p1  ORF type:complete len:766 (-),score=167.78 TRINITY_DN1866_c0_g1_i1:1192-3147(-)
MGYAQEGQTGAGISFRLRARAFIFADPVTQNRIVFVSADSCMIFTGVKSGVVQKLQILYGGLYTDDNVMLSGIHTHSGPAGYSHYIIYNLMSWGFQEGNYDTIVNGIVQAIQQAHEKLSTGGSIYMNSGELLDSNINRSPAAYLMNPAEERAKYQYDVDKLMTVLRLEDENGQELGMVNWFAVHGTSMNNTNRLVSGDNKGVASYLFEKYKNGASTLPGTGSFVAAFAQSNEGDVSPNTRGAFCDNGDPCEFAHSTCGGRSENCHGYGPGKTDFESTLIIGQKQFNKAVELYEKATTQIVGTVNFIHTYVDMSNVTVNANFSGTGEDGYTCHGSLGDSFAAGTTDGPGDFNFVQGTNTSKNPLWNFIGSFLSDPTPQEIACQAPKQILLNTGDVDFPSPWTPKILPLQIFQLGQLYIVGVPGEFTTMSGRRLRDTVQGVLESNGISNATVVIAGLSNAYSHYIATREEFGFQRYEGASTLFGPFTLAAYQQNYAALANALVNGESYPAGPTPPDLSNFKLDFLPGVILDAHPIGKGFGHINIDVESSYQGNQTATAQFWGASPRNDYRIQGTFLSVEQSQNGSWTTILTDGDPETRFRWVRHGLAESLVTVEWDIPEGTTGTFRLNTFGTSKDLFGKLSPYQGTSSTFTVS